MADLFETLSQATYWTTNDGCRTRLDMMKPTHRANVRRWLRRHAVTLHDMVASEYLYGPAPTAEMASHEFDREFDAHERMTPQQWLMSQPLYRRLVELVWRDRTEER